MPRQLIVLKPGIDMVQATWVAAIKNDQPTPATLMIPVLMPKDAKDFTPLEGLTADEVRLGDAGLVVEKSFPTGVTVVSVGFVVPAGSGKALMGLTTGVDVGELTVMAPRGLLGVESRDLIAAGSDVQDMQRYNMWTSRDKVLANQTVQILISDVPEGRTKLWAIGAILGLMIVGGSIVFARKTIPRIQSANSVV
jgi:hypothetical protein